MHRHKAEIPLAGAILDQYRHVCAFFHSPDEEYRVLLPFIKEGIDQGEQAFHIVDSTLRPDYVRRWKQRASMCPAVVPSAGRRESHRRRSAVPGRSR